MSKARRSIRIQWATAIWAACSLALLVATGVLAAKILFGRDYREQAFADVQRLEFELTYEDGSAIPHGLKGETLTLETALAMAEAASAGQPEPAPPAEAAPVEASPAVPAPTEAPPAEASPAGESPSSAETAPQDPATQPPAQPGAPAETPEPPAGDASAPEVTPPQAASLAPVETMTDQGVIPAIAADGTKPWQYFAKQDYIRQTDRPRIAVVVKNLGLARTTTEAAIALPAEVSLSFSPYGRETAAELAETARKAGHEILLDLPMQTDRFPAVDPGPYGIRADLTAEENHQRLMTVLTKLRGYVGLLAPARDMVSLDRALTAPLIDGFAKQGLLFVSGYSQQPPGMLRLRRQAGVPILFTDVELDGQVNETYILNQLARAEDIARSRGFAIAVGHAYPLTLDLLGDWSRELATKGFILVPVSAIGEAQQ